MKTYEGVAERKKLRKDLLKINRKRHFFLVRYGVADVDTCGLSLHIKINISISQKARSLLGFYT